MFQVNRRSTMDKGQQINVNKIDERKAQLITHKIIVEEVNNLKSKTLSDSAMVKKIQKMIQEEVECF